MSTTLEFFIVFTLLIYEDKIKFIVYLINFLFLFHQNLVFKTKLNFHGSFLQLPLTLDTKFFRMVSLEIYQQNKLS